MGRAWLLAWSAPRRDSRHSCVYLDCLSLPGQLKAMTCLAADQHNCQLEAWLHRLQAQAPQFMHLLGSWIGTACPPVTFTGPPALRLQHARSVGTSRLYYPTCGQSLGVLVASRLQATHVASCRAGVWPQMDQSSGLQSAS